MTTALVTGGSGFVGSAVVRALLAAGHRVRVLLRPRSDARNLDGLPVERVTGQLGDIASLDAALAGCDALFHVAADYRLWAPDPGELYRTNVTGTDNVMRAASRAGVARIVYTSSVATLGIPADGTPGDEETPVTLDDMVGHYKRSKFLAERKVIELVAELALPAVIVNPSTPVGPRDVRPTPTGRMVHDAARGRMPAYVDTGLNIVHVDDVAAGHLLAFMHGRLGERYVLGGDNLTLREIFSEIAAITGHPAPRWRLSPSALMPLARLAQAWARLSRGGEPRLTTEGLLLARKIMHYSSAKARRELRYASRPAREALADAVAWFRGRGRAD